MARDGEALKADQVVGAIAEGVLAKVVTARVVAGPKVKGKASYRVQIANESPLILNGIALAAATKIGRELGPDFVGPPEPECASMNGFSLAPAGRWPSRSRPSWPGAGATTRSPCSPRT